MLPDLVLLKKDLADVLMRYMRVQADRRLGTFADAAVHFLHEGDRSHIWQADDSIDDIEKKTASAEMTLAVADIPAMTLDERMRRLDQMAETMAKQKYEGLWASLNATLEHAGQVMDHKGKPLDAEAILAVLELIDIDFSRDGQQSPLTIVVPPNMGDAARIAFEQLERDPELKARHDALTQRKRAEWRDREAARKLVG